MNALSLAFFAPAPLAGSGCEFSGDDSPCMKPASGAGNQVSLKWVKATITSTAASLKNNLSPGMKKPIYFISFGGYAEGGTGWDSVFNDATKAASFGTNAAALVKQVEKDTKGVATIGIDLDTEGITQLANFGAFATAFRKDAPFDQYPLMMCALSALARSTSADFFKYDIVRQYGPMGKQTKALNFLNMMVNNVDTSCKFMTQYWLEPSLNWIIPISNRVFDVWGLNNLAWLIHDPGCDDDTGKFFDQWKSSGASMGVWEWWIGDPTPLKAFTVKIKQ